MKSIKVLICLCALVVFSCETEDANLQEEELINADLKARTTTPPPGWEDWDSQEFSGWISTKSQHIAHAVYWNETARQEFQDIVDAHATDLQGNSSIVIPLEALLSNTDSVLYQAIKGSIACLGHPDGGWGDPYPPLGNGVLPFTEHDYLNNILNEHCLELYLPFGFSSFGLSRNFKVIGTGHPLNFTNINNVYNARQFETGVGCYIIEIDEKETYNNLLILRPNPGYSINQDGYCDYAIYSNIDFTDFFEQ